MRKESHRDRKFYGYSASLGATRGHFGSFSRLALAELPAPGTLAELQDTEQSLSSSQNLEVACRDSFGLSCKLQRQVVFRVCLGRLAIICTTEIGEVGAQ